MSEYGMILRLCHILKGIGIGLWEITPRLVQ